MFDAIVILAACDKTLPGSAMALIRLDIPGFVLYGGSIQPGRFQGRDVTIVDVFDESRWAELVNAIGRVMKGTTDAS